jgi:hypothetical protein
VKIYKPGQRVLYKEAGIVAVVEVLESSFQDGELSYKVRVKRLLKNTGMKIVKKEGTPGKDS